MSVGPDDLRLIACNLQGRVLHQVALGASYEAGGGVDQLAGLAVMNNRLAEHGEGLPIPIGEYLLCVHLGSKRPPDALRIGREPLLWPGRAWGVRLGFVQVDPAPLLALQQLEGGWCSGEASLTHRSGPHFLGKSRPRANKLVGLPHTTRLPWITAR